MQGKQILEKPKWIILISFPAGDRKLGAVLNLGTPCLAQPLPPRLSQDPSALLGSQNALDQTRRLLHSTGRSQSWDVRESEGRTHPGFLGSGVKPSSATSTASSAQAGAGNLPSGVSSEMPQHFLSPQRLLGLFAWTILVSGMLLKGHTATEGCSSRIRMFGSPVSLRGHRGNWDDPDELRGRR